MAKTLSLTFDEIDATLINANNNMSQNYTGLFQFLYLNGNSTNTTSIKSVFSLFGTSFSDIATNFTNKTHFYCKIGRQYFNVSLYADSSEIKYSYMTFSFNENVGTYLYSGKVTRNAETDSAYVSTVYPMVDLSLSYLLPSSFLQVYTQEQMQSFLTTNFGSYENLSSIANKNLYVIDAQNNFIPVRAAIKNTSIRFYYEILQDVPLRCIFSFIVSSGTLNITSFNYVYNSYSGTYILDNSILTFETGNSYEVMTTWLEDLFGTYNDSLINAMNESSRYLMPDNNGYNSECLIFNLHSKGGDNMELTFAFFDSQSNKIVRKDIQYNPTQGTITVTDTSIPS